MERDIKPTYDELESYVENLQKQLADAQATIAALQARVKELEEWQQIVAGTQDRQDLIYQISSQLTQRTAELEAANTLLYKKNCALGRAETIINDLQAELERVRGQYAELGKMVLALPKVEGAVVVSNGYVKDSTRCHALFGADEDAALYAALLQHRQGMEG